MSEMYIFEKFNPFTINMNILHENGAGPLEYNRTLKQNCSLGIYTIQYANFLRSTVLLVEEMKMSGALKFC